EEYLKWDDWRVQGMLHEDPGEHGKILRERNHHRCVYQTPEVTEVADIKELEHVANELDDMVSHIDTATSSWYKLGEKDIPILLRPNEADEELVYLSKLSSIVRGLKPIEQTRLYVPPERKEKALEIVSKIRKSKEYEG
ncbi:MAG: HD domain-containing protein, partial [bacterium]|nr:HD domain-containing protein [bacterium]